MVYIIMERKAWGDGDKPIKVFISKRKCRECFSKVLCKTMEKYPTAVQSVFNDGNGLNFDLDDGSFISYEVISMEVSK